MILVRHGQTVFNLHFGATRTDPGVEDPGLTDLGRAQAREAAERLAGRGLRQLVVSPYRRTLETAAILADALHLPVRIEPLVRERFGFSCDIGTPRARLSVLWPHHDFAHLDESWWHDGDEPEAFLISRCEAFRRSVSSDPAWRHVGVITHWGVIRALTGRTVGNGELVPFDPTASIVTPDDPC